VWEAQREKRGRRMNESKQLRKPRRPQSADSSAVLAYLQEMELYTVALELVGQQLLAHIRLLQSELDEARRAAVAHIDDPPF
jgi:hypothetical protein